MTDTKTYDFQDGNGPVPAQQHPNGGGWVADTATVEKTACRTKCQSFWQRKILGQRPVHGNARVYGEAKVHGNARV